MRAHAWPRLPPNACSLAVRLNRPPAHTGLPTVQRITERTPDPAWPAPAGEIEKRERARTKPRSKPAPAKKQASA